MKVSKNMYICIYTLVYENYDNCIYSVYIHAIYTLFVYIIYTYRFPRLEKKKILVFNFSKNFSYKIEGEKFLAGFL